MAATFALRMAFRTFIAAIVSVVLFDGIVDVDDANAGIAGTDLLGHLWHGVSPNGFRGRDDG